MSNSAEKIKAFFSDEQKIKELTSDEKFIKMVSDESATPEDYQEKFKKLGLDLSLEEVEEIHNTVKKIFETPTEKLNEDFLKNISGGGTGAKVAAGVGLTAAGLVAADVLSATGCIFAGLVYQSLSRKADNHGDWEAELGYDKKAAKCFKAAGYMTILPAVLEHIANS